MGTPADPTVFGPPLGIVPHGPLLPLLLWKARKEATAGFELLAMPGTPACFPSTCPSLSRLSSKLEVPKEPLSCNDGAFPISLLLSSLARDISHPPTALPWLGPGMKRPPPQIFEAELFDILNPPRPPLELQSVSGDWVAPPGGCGGGAANAWFGALGGGICGGNF